MRCGHHDDVMFDCLFPKRCERRTDVVCEVRSVIVEGVEEEESDIWGGSRSPSTEDSKVEESVVISLSGNLSITFSMSLFTDLLISSLVCKFNYWCCRLS